TTSNHSTIGQTLRGPRMAKAPDFIISHWYHLVEGLQASPKDFYASVEQAVAARSLPDTATDRADWHEGAPFSPLREYLRVIRKEHVFDICGAPYGKGFFISWWLGEMGSGCLTLAAPIPVVGAVLAALLRPQTYYRYDTALMFQTSVNA